MSSKNLYCSKKWKKKKQEILERDNHTCVLCGSKEHLCVHHRQYYFYREENFRAKIYDYPNDMLITLCETCHNKEHTMYGIPEYVIPVKEMKEKVGKDFLENFCDILLDGEYNINIVGKVMQEQNDCPVDIGISSNGEMFFL